jgi:predicted porin
MHRKRIVLTAALLASGAALAQSSVQIYGSVDVGFSHRGDNLDKSVNSQNAIDSGISSGNRLGFSGVEDLGNGLKALVQLEAGFLADTGEHDQEGQLFGRQAFAGLSHSDLGSIIAGRLYTPHYSFVSTIDPFKGGTVGRYNNTYGADVDPLGGYLLDPVRVDNAVAYVSPDWKGFSVTAAYSRNAIAQDESGNGRNQAQVFAILPRYAHGPVDVAISYHRIKVGANYVGAHLPAGIGLGPNAPYGAVVEDVTNWLVGGSYDFGVARLAAFYSDNKLEFDTPANPLGLTDDLKVKNWMLGVTLPFGKHAVLASYNQSRARYDHAGGTAKQWALGYTYAFSKRTNLYVAYADIRNDDGRNDYARRATSGDVSNADASGYQNGFQFGVKHTF